MQFRTAKKVLAAVLSGCMLAICVPAESKAAEQILEEVQISDYMAKILQGEFSFTSAEEVSAEALQQQISEKLESGVTANVVWKEETKCYELTLTKGEESLTSPLYVNSEVAISDFTEEFLQNCTMRKAATTVIDTKDGAISVHSTEGMTYENVVLPVFNYGRDYMLSVDLKVTDSVNTARWAAMSYGVTKNQELGDNCFTFWQMAVRRNAAASNGVECATMKADGSWNVPSTASYTESLDSEKTYNLKIVVKDKNVYEYINDQLMIKYDVWEQMKFGKVAFTFDRITAEYSNFIVTSEIPEDLQTEFPKVENGYEADIYEPVTGLVMAPAVVSENDNKTIAELISGQSRPSTMIRTVSENMTVVDDNQEITIADYIAKTDKKALAGFRIENMDIANAFAEYVKENNLVDIMVIANEPEILLAACNRMPGVHGMLDCGAYENNTTADMFELVSKTNEANSRVLVLPQKLATKENIKYIQARAISVWVRTEKAQVMNVILNGADGILTEDYENAYNVIESFDEETTVLTRNTVITAHRGLHMTAPENSERAAKLAVEAGADAIECDVLLSKDGQVVINHDDTTERLMNENLVVADSTLEELQKLTFNTNAEVGDKIPTLQELFIAADEADPDDDVIHVIEIKTSDTNVIEPMVKIIKDMNMEDRVVFISFYDYQLELIRQAMPNVAVGELNSICSSTDDVATALKKLCDRMDTYGYFYNCNYGAQSTEILQAARFRGIYVHPWTVNSQDIFESEYVNNYHGITTDRSNFATNYLNKVVTESNTYTLNINDNKGVAIETKAYTRMGTEIPNTNIIMKQISGTPVTYDAENEVCYAETTGEAVVLMGAVYPLETIGKSYTVYSEPITLDIINEEEVKVTPTEVEKQKETQTITAKDITKSYGEKAFSIKAKTDGDGKLTYTSNNKKVVTVSENGKVTIRGCGKADIKIRAAETTKYKAAEKKITITVKPKKQKISSIKLTNAKNMIVKWKKDTKATGYVLQYSTDKNFKKNVKKVTISSSKTTSKKIVGLKAGKKYYVKVCSYKKASGAKVTGNYSAVKSVTIKK